MRRALAVPAGLGLVLLAFAVGFSVPGRDAIEAPFAATGQVGEAITSQHHIITVNEVSLAREVELSTWRGTTAGIWLVVDVTAEARFERQNVDVAVFLGGAEYPATRRASRWTLDGGVVDPGFPMAGPVLVELPADVVERGGASSAVLRLGGSGDIRLDSVVELKLDLTALEVHDRVELDRARSVSR